MYKWKVEYLERLSNMSNEQLFDEYNSLIVGGDYDGCHTKKGWWMWEQVQKEFIDRLKKNNFLK